METQAILICNEVPDWWPIAKLSPERYSPEPLIKPPIHHENGSVLNGYIPLMNKKKETLKVKTESRSNRRIQSEVFPEFLKRPVAKNICKGTSNLNILDEKKELLVLGNFVGRLLEAFPKVVRYRALKDIEEAERRYCFKIRKCYGLSPILSPQLWDIEHDRAIPALNGEQSTKRRKITSSYGDIIESHLISIPLNLRAGILKEICTIVDYYGSMAEKEFGKTHPR